MTFNSLFWCTCQAFDISKQFFETAHRFTGREAVLQLLIPANKPRCASSAPVPKKGRWTCGWFKIMMCWRLHRSFLVANIFPCSGESTEPFLNSSNQRSETPAHIRWVVFSFDIWHSCHLNQFFTSFKWIYGAIFGQLRAKALSSVQN